MGLGRRKTYCECTVSNGTDVLISACRMCFDHLPAPSNDIDKPTAQGAADASPEGGNQVNVCTPLSYLSNGQKIYNASAWDLEPHGVFD